ncbi:MAG: cytochrome C oxidase subunit IV family protein [Pseudomonas sp.]
MLASRFLLGCWLALAVLSLATVGLAQGAVSSGAVLLLAVLKAWLITDGFMELRHGPWRWRVLLLAWAGVLALVVGISLNLRG